MEPAPEWVGLATPGWTQCGAGPRQARLVRMTWMLRALVRGGMAIVSAVLLAVHIALLVPGFGLGLLFLIPWPFARMRG